MHSQSSPRSPKEARHIFEQCHSGLSLFQHMAILKHHLGGRVGVPPIFIAGGSLGAVWLAGKPFHQEVIISLILQQAKLTMHLARPAASHNALYFHEEMARWKLHCPVHCKGRRLQITCKRLSHRHTHGLEPKNRCACATAQWLDLDLPLEINVNWKAGWRIKAKHQVRRHKVLSNPIRRSCLHTECSIFRGKQLNFGGVPPNLWPNNPPLGGSSQDL